MIKKAMFLNLRWHKQEFGKCYWQIKQTWILINHSGPFSWADFKLPESKSIWIHLCIMYYSLLFIVDTQRILLNWLEVASIHLFIVSLTTFYKLCITSFYLTLQCNSANTFTLRNFLFVTQYKQKQFGVLCVWCKFPNEKHIMPDRPLLGMDETEVTSPGF